MRPRLRTMVAVVVGLALAGASLGAQPASAGITEVRSCDASTLNVDSFGQAWEVSAYGTSWIPQNTCPEGIVFDADSPTIWDHPEWVTWFNANTTSILRTAEFTYFGGDTSGAYRYTINACEDRWCDEIMELTPGADADSPSVAQVTLTSLQISSFAIQGRCVVEICPDPPPFVVKNFLLEYSDEVSPSLVNLNVTPSGATDPGSPVWLDGDELKLEFDAVDSGSGVALVVMGVDQPTTENLAGDKCGYGGRAAYCPAVAHISKTIDLSAVSSGEHLVRIVIYDAALSDPLVLDLPIRIDRKPPDEPSGVSATGGVTKWGWTSDPLVTVAHDDPSDSPDFVSESGWKSATFDLRESANGEVVQSHISTLPAATTQFTLPHEGRWDVGVTYRDNAENVGNRAHAFVGYDLDTPLPADPEPLGWISLNDLYA
ncbi:MAG: hypothetical protein JHD02_07915, partial [Thermoleophilaceae bacterium]|nr:hypothetical protein [Thermoleophilaceae bacterium]